MPIPKHSRSSLTSPQEAPRAAMPSSQVSHVIMNGLIQLHPRDTNQLCATGKLTIDDQEYSLNAEFQEDTYQLADEIDLDEVEAAKLLLDCQGDTRTLGRTLFESGLVRFHQQRRYLLDCMRLCIQIADDDELDTNLQDVFSAYVAEHIYGAGTAGGTKIVSRCMEAMQGVKNWLQKLSDRTTAATVFHGTDRPPIDEVLEYSRVSLLQQHELLALVMANAIDKRHAKVDDFKSFLKFLEKLDRYDQLLGMKPVFWRLKYTSLANQLSSSSLTHYWYIYHCIWVHRGQWGLRPCS